MKNITKFSQFFWTSIIFFILFCVIISPARFLQVGLDGISAWAFNVLPAIFPFMFFTRCLMCLGSVETLVKPLNKFSSTLFNCPPISIHTFAMAILSGYPVGTKMVADLYSQGKITQNDAFKMTSFCSTSGPMFIIGAVGVGMFHSPKIGYILFLSHILGAIINGIMFRNLKKGIMKKREIETEDKNFDIYETIVNSSISILSVGGIIMIFFIVIECFQPLFNIFPTQISCFLSGLFEITKGCICLSTLSPYLATILCSFVISFGGLSTILQSQTMLSQVKMPTKLFVFQKFCHACFSLLLSILFIAIFGL